MPRFALLSFNQASSESLGVFLRGLQWPSLSSFLSRSSSDSNKNSNDSQQQLTVPTQHSLQSTSLLNRVLQSRVGSRLYGNGSAHESPGNGTPFTSSSSGSTIFPFALLKLLLPTALAAGFASYYAPQPLTLEAGNSPSTTTTATEHGSKLSLVVKTDDAGEEVVEAAEAAPTTGLDDSPSLSTPVASDTIGPVEPTFSSAAQSDLPPSVQMSAPSNKASKASNSNPASPEFEPPSPPGTSGCPDPGTDNPGTILPEEKPLKVEATPEANVRLSTREEKEDGVVEDNGGVKASKETNLETRGKNCDELQLTENNAKQASSEDKEITASSSDELAATCMSSSTMSDVQCQKDPLKCTHSTKHINFSKCSSAFKKKSFVLNKESLLCLQCGKTWLDDASAETHSSRSNHPVMIDCSDGSLICFKCGRLDVSESFAAQTEPTLTETTNIRGLVKLKLPSSSSSKTTKSAKSSSEVEVDMNSDNVVIFGGNTKVKNSDDHNEILDLGVTSTCAPQGLKNLGNTCFFNSSIQVLAQSQHVQAALKDNSNIGPLAMALGKCLRDVARISSSGANSAVVVKRSGGGKKRNNSNVAGGVISPAALFSAVCKVAPHFSGFEQQDAQELITFLLGGIEDEATKSVSRPLTDSKSLSTKAQAKSAAAAKSATKTPKKATQHELDGWNLKHADFWFGGNVPKVEIERTPPDEDDEGLPPNSISVSSSDEDEQDDYWGNEEEEKQVEVSRNQEHDVLDDEEQKDNESKTEIGTPAIRSNDGNGATTKVLNLTKEVFQIDLESVVVCDDCETETVRKESQYMLSLAIGGGGSAANSSNSASSSSKVKGGKSSSSSGSNKRKSGGDNSSSGENSTEPLSDCFTRFFSPERLLVDDGNGFQCNKCAFRRGQKAEQAPQHDATRRLRISALSDVLIIHFKRFQQVDRGGKGVKAVKIETHVTLEDTLHFPAFGDYTLVGVVEHLGKSLHGGHYVAYVRTGSDATSSTWYRCSDDIVSRVTQNQVFDSVQAYIAIYERR